MDGLLMKYFVLQTARGTPVVVRKDSGALYSGETRSEAYICDSGHPVIFVTGISGYYLLDRVQAVQP